MKKIVAIGVMLIAWAGVAGTVTVEGRGCVTRHPDGMKLRFSLEAVDKDMAKSRIALAAKRAKIRTAMAAAGVVDEEVTDSNIRMNPEYHNEDAEGNVLSEYTEKGKRVFGGYKQ